MLPEVKPANRRDVITTIRMALSGTLDGGHRRRKARSLADTAADQRLAEAIVKALEARNFQIMCGPGADWHSTP